MITYPLYRLPLPSGVVCRVRKADRLALLGHGVLYLPLLSVAVDAVRSEDSPVSTPTEYLRSLNEVCRACWCEEYPVEELDLTDRMALQQWALAPVIEPAVRDGERLCTSADVAPVVRSASGAILLDAIARRYSLRPSVLVGLEADPELSVDFDLAIGYRGLAGEHDTAGGEVEVPDQWGEMHRVPANVLPATDPGARVVHADDFARRMAKMGLKEMSISAGGALGCQPGMELGNMNRFQQ